MYVTNNIPGRKAFANILSLALTGVHKIVTPDLLAYDEDELDSLLSPSSSSSANLQPNYSLDVAGAQTDRAVGGSGSQLDNVINKSLSSYNSSINGSSVVTSTMSKTTTNSSSSSSNQAYAGTTTARSRHGSNNNPNRVDVQLVNWADDDESRPAHKAQRDGRLAEMGSPYHKAHGGQGHSHNGKCCQHDHGNTRSAELMTAPLTSMNMDNNDRV
jgi:hypothetical protein